MNLFFAFTPLFLYFELISFAHTDKVITVVNAVKLADKPVGMWLFLITSWLYLIWIVIGLATPQWPLFLVLFLLGFMPRYTRLMIRLNAVISIILLLLALINQYHHIL